MIEIVFVCPRGRTTDYDFVERHVWWGVAKVRIKT